MNIRYLATNLVNLFITAVEGFLGLRFLLKLFGANANNGFVDWIYDMSDVLLEPFRGIFPAEVLDNRYVLEFTTLFAMLIYAILGLLLVWLVDILSPSKATGKKKR